MEEGLNMEKYFPSGKGKEKLKERLKAETVIRIPETVWMAGVKKAGGYGDCLSRRKATKKGPLPKTNIFRFGAPKLSRFWS
jgi:hypothetical protein